MNRIVRERYPVSQLPEDIRKEFPGQQEVTLIVDGLSAHDIPETKNDDSALAEIRRTGIRGGDFSRFKRLRRANFQSGEDVGAYLDTLRDEWVHRER